MFKLKHIFSAMLLAFLYPSAHAQTITITDAISLPLNQVIDGTIQTPKEKDHYKIKIKKKGVITIESYGSTDVKGILYNALGEKLIAVDNGGTNKNFKLSYQVEPSTYYLRIKNPDPQGTGAYQVKAILDTTTSQSLIFPFTSGQWTICQGYNTPEISHTGSLIHAFDLSMATNASNANGYGCLGSPNATTGQNVIAPSNGTVAWISPVTNDMVCITLPSPAANGAQSILLGHFTALTTLSRGSSVKQGEILGTVNPPSTKNGLYAHIHISTHTSNNCLSTGVSLSDSLPLGSIFGSKYNFISTGKKHEWYGTQVAQ